MIRMYALAIVLFWSFTVVKYDGRGRAVHKFRKLKARDVFDLSLYVAKRESTLVRRNAIYRTVVQATVTI